MKRGFLTSNLKPEWEALLMLGGVTLAVTAVSWALARWMLHSHPDVLSPIFRALLALDLQYLPAFMLATLLAAVLARRAGPLVSAMESIGRHPWVTAIVVLIFLAALAPAVYRAHPVSMDEYAVVFQSKVFASGHLAGHFPHEWLSRLIPPWFQHWFLVTSPVTDDVISGYWPGFALLMAPFAWFGVEWLCNPVLTAISMGVLAIVTRKMMPNLPAAPGWAVAFAVASPAVVIQGVSFYAMTSLMLANLLFIWGFLDPRPRPLFWSGVVGSVALTLHNPLPHILFAIPWVVWLIREKGWGRELWVLILGYVPLSLLLGVGWMLLRGHVEGTAGDIDAADPFGSLMGVTAQMFTLPNRAILVMRAAGLVKLWVWAMPGLLVLASLGWWRDRTEPYIGLLVASAYLTFIGYFFVPVDQGHGWGYRYFHSAWFVLPLLAARYVALPTNKWNQGIRLFAAGLVVAGLVIVTPIYSIGTARVVAGFMSQAPSDDASRPLRLTFIYPDRGFYAADLIQNDPFLRGDDLRLLGSTPAADAILVKSLSPDAKIVARSETGIMWHLPVPPEGLEDLLSRVGPAPR